MRSNCHFVEIDLLRDGVRFGPLEALPPHDYLVHVSRKGLRPRATVWPIRLEQPLPVIDIPLRGEDSDAKLDLQSATTLVYDRNGYRFQLPYASQPTPDLPEPRARWMNELLISKGVRVAS